jgi:hypothetical protein
MHMQLKVWCKMEGFARDSKDWENMYEETSNN